MTNAAELFVQKPDKPRVWETIGAALRLIWEHPFHLMVPLAIVQALIATESVILGEVRTGDEPLRIDLFLVLGLLQSLLAAVGLGTTVVIAAALRWDELVSPAAAFNLVFRRLFPLFAVTAVGWVLYLPVAFGNREVQDWPVLGIVLVGVWIVSMLYLGLRLAVDTQLLLLEGSGPFEAIRGSWRLMNGYMLRLLGIFVVQGVVGNGIGLGLGFALIATDLPQAVMTIVSHLVSIPVAVFGTVAVTLYYLRIRETGVQREDAEYEPVGSA